MYNNTYLDEAQYLEAYQIYLSGKTLEETAAQFNRAGSSMRDAFKRRGWELRKRTWPKVPWTNKFSTVTPESAYWVGFLMADGHIFEGVRDNVGVALKLSIKDIGHIEKFKSFMEATQSIQIEKASSGQKLSKYNLTPSAKIRISSKQVVEDLAKFGILPRKTGKEKVVGLENNTDFWRGVVDGDGSISLSNTTKHGIVPSFTLVGSFDLMTQFANYINPIVNSKLSVRSRNNHLYSIQASGFTAAKICFHLYHEAEVYLDRKYEKAREAMMFSGFKKVV